MTETISAFKATAHSQRASRHSAFIPYLQLAKSATACGDISMAIRQADYVSGLKVWCGAPGSSWNPFRGSKGQNYFHNNTQVLPAFSSSSHKHCYSVAKSYLTSRDLMDCSAPGSPVPHHLPGVSSSSCPLNQWCHPTVSSSVAPFSFFLNKHT